MKALAALMIGMMVVCAGAGCKKKPAMNSVDLDQINADDSNNYRYIFRETIQEEKERDRKNDRKQF